jgi:hypothetical protein
MITDCQVHTRCDGKDSKIVAYETSKIDALGVLSDPSQ